MQALQNGDAELAELLRRIRDARNGDFHDAGYVISCDYMGAWAWHFLPDRSAFQGSNCACANDWSGDKPIGAELTEDFQRWQDRFETGPLDDIPKGADGVDGFSWRRFHAEGLRLAKRLKRELGPEYVVIYSRPFEDQTGRGPASMLVTQDGQALRYRHTPKTVFRDSPPQLN